MTETLRYIPIKAEYHETAESGAKTGYMGYADDSAKRRGWLRLMGLWDTYGMCYDKNNVTMTKQQFYDDSKYGYDIAMRIVFGIE